VHEIHAAQMEHGMTLPKAQAAFYAHCTPAQIQELSTETPFHCVAARKNAISTTKPGVYATMK